MGSAEGREVDDLLRMLGLELPAPSRRDLVQYTDLLTERAVPLGMIGPREANRILPRHVMDSLRAAPAVMQLRPDTVVDLGSGAGLPGIPLAIAFVDIRFTLAESRSRRAAFLELVVERLALSNVVIHADRAETLPEGRFDAATARAFASPGVTWDAARRLLRPGGGLVLFAGSGGGLPNQLPGASGIEPIAPGPSSWATSPLASPGPVVIIRST